MAAKLVAVVIGSLRKESFSRKLARAAIELAPASLEAEIVEIGALALYNPDDDETGRVPTSWAAFRQRIKGALPEE